MSTAYYYKLGFLTACADRGLGPDAAEALAERVLARAGRGVKTAAGFSPLGLAAGVATAPVWLAGQAFRGAGNLGAHAGLLAGRMWHGDPDDHLTPFKAKGDMTLQNDRLARIQAMTAELKRRKAELVKTPGLFA